MGEVAGGADPYGEHLAVHGRRRDVEVVEALGAGGVAGGAEAYVVSRMGGWGGWCGGDRVAVSGRGRDVVVAGLGGEGLGGGGVGAYVVSRMGGWGGWCGGDRVAVHGRGRDVVVVGLGGEGLGGGGVGGGVEACVVSQVGGTGRVVLWGPRGCAQAAAYVVSKVGGAGRAVGTTWLCTGGGGMVTLPGWTAAVSAVVGARVAWRFTWFPARAVTQEPQRCVRRGCGARRSTRGPAG
ncbi:hypothetical protein M2157_006488 [Streptomyces sp. SAI-127]|nr:hypothetical protein [Streptomyces sp. SAI-127]